MRRRAESANLGCHHSLRRSATRSSPRPGSGFAACPSQISCKARTNLEREIGLAREIVQKGEHALTTTTTRIFAAQIALAPAHVAATDATCESVWAALGAHRHLLVSGATDAATGTAGGVSLDLFGRLRAWCPRVCPLNEADGSRMPF